MKASDSFGIWMICCALAIVVFIGAMAIFNLYYERQQYEANYRALAEIEATRAEIFSAHKTNDGFAIYRFSVKQSGDYRLIVSPGGRSILELLAAEE